MPRFFQQSDLERALGGADVLVQLGDKNQDGVADLDFVNDCLDYGTNEMASLIQRKVDLTSLSAPFPLALVFKSADIGAFVAWTRGSAQQAMPPNVQAAHEAAVRWGVQVGDGEATLGISPKPSLDPPAEQLDYDPNAIGLSIAGFKRGFR